MELPDVREVAWLEHTGQAVHPIERCWAQDSLGVIARVDRALLGVVWHDPGDQIRQSLRVIPFQALQQITDKPIGAVVRDEIAWSQTERLPPGSRVGWA